LCHLFLQAQCGELERLRLVDGTITEDSDAFAFGGKAVYRNIFNERKFVEVYLLADAERVGDDARLLFFFTCSPC
ncbi:unnamed protein product, partial [Discosporangium mesarthrocarpum]